MQGGVVGLGVVVGVDVGVGVSVSVVVRGTIFSKSARCEFYCTE